MHARLDFSIAAIREPGVLIIDEVLSVGDIAFQQRCLERMESFKRNGVTLVFVSHNLAAVANLCDRALFLNRKVGHIGSVADAVAAYLRASSAQGEAASGAVDIERATLTNQDHRRVATAP